MPTYKIPCVWQMTGDYIVEAESEEEAIEKTYELPLSEAVNTEYLTGSHTPDTEEIELIKL